MLWCRVSSKCAHRSPCANLQFFLWMVSGGFFVLGESFLHLKWSVFMPKPSHWWHFLLCCGPVTLLHDQQWLQPREQCHECFRPDNWSGWMRRLSRWHSMAQRTTTTELVNAWCFVVLRILCSAQSVQSQTICVLLGLSLERIGQYSVPWSTLDALSVPRQLLEFWTVSSFRLVWIGRNTQPNHSDPQEWRWQWMQVYPVTWCVQQGVGRTGSALNTTMYILAQERPLWTRLSWATLDLANKYFTNAMLVCHT